MPDATSNNEILIKLLERFDQLERRVTGEIQSVNKRFDSLDTKFTGEIQSVHGEIRDARKESQDFHNAAKETWGQLERVVVNSEHKVTSFIEEGRREWREYHRLALEIWEGIRRAIEKDNQRTLNYEKALARVNEEINELKRDKAALEATVRDMQQRLNRLEAAQNPAG